MVSSVLTVQEKTTLFRIMATLLLPDEGTVSVEWA